MKLLSMQKPLTDKQVEFVMNANSKWNFAHGAVRTGKTVGTLFAFMHKVDVCLDSKIYITGHTFDTAYRNIIRLLMESMELAVYRSFCTWSGKKLSYKDKTITVLGAKDEGSIGNFQGDTYSLVYCDEMTLYPTSIIEMIDTRLSRPESMGFGAMNPTYPKHIIKQWIDAGLAGDKNYYSLHFELDDNTFLDEDYKNRIRNSSTGLFYKRNVLGIWCLAEGAIFDFFDHRIHVVDTPPRGGTDYYISAIDYGSVNPFACLLVGVSTGIHTQTGVQMWVEKEYYYDHKKRTKLNSELATDIEEFLEPYNVKAIYIDPSAEAFQRELNRRGINAVHANNDVYNGIQMMCDDLRNGKIVIMDCCKNLIREIESYTWDRKAAEKGLDRPIKKDDHLIDCLRYLCATHKVVSYNPYKHNPTKYQLHRFGTQSNF